MNDEVQAPKQAQYVGVHCQSCGVPIPVPARVTRQIADQEKPEAERYYVSTLFNLRCRACHKEHFYDLSEAREIEGKPRSHAHSRYGGSKEHALAGSARAAHV